MVVQVHALPGIEFGCKWDVAPPRASPTRSGSRSRHLSRPTFCTWPSSEERIHSNGRSRGNFDNRE